MTEWWERGAERSDKLMTAVGWVLVFGSWITDRQIKDRLADVDVPHGAGHNLDLRTNREADT